jgi:hypothetical protein
VDDSEGASSACRELNVENSPPRRTGASGDFRIRRGAGNEAVLLAAAADAGLLFDTPLAAKPAAKLGGSPLKAAPPPLGKYEKGKGDWNAAAPESLSEPPPTG